MYLNTLYCGGTWGVIFQAANFLSTFRCLDAGYFQQHTLYLTTISMKAPTRIVGISLSLMMKSDSTSCSISMPYDMRNMRGLLNFWSPNELAKNLMISSTLEAVSKEQLNRLSRIIVSSFSISTTELSE
ncbi:hypothetical protein OGATHE_005685 [Ogataea polymorpha]|uniref:Uncharacterized protein n=1 Tax=Ogataea polymorpha TaxID=460523 RepID=A0A9P8NTV2_9ASCO|nr:hypothetical protein OGATHE_005685 [Ogataea polymorpha]